MAQGFLRDHKLVRSIVALGANLDSSVGAPISSLTYAIDKLGSDGSDANVKITSKFYQTPCFPEGAGPDYVNAVIILETRLSPQKLLQRFHQIESDLGRVRMVRWAGRTLDIDLISYGNQVLPNHLTVERWIDLDLEKQLSAVPDQLILPHPRIQDRPFVLVPLCEIWPDWMHPFLGMTARQLLNRIPAQEIAKVIAL